MMKKMLGVENVLTDIMKDPQPNPLMTIHQIDCIVHAVLGFLLWAGDSSGGGISGGAVLGTQRNS